MNENINNNKNKYLLPPKTTNKKTLVLDLDETLVHSQFLEFSTPSDIIIKIEIEKEIYEIYVLVRPGVKEFLEKMEQYYEIVIFTASISKYADILINIIDQNDSCPYRLFREHCTFINNSFVKDLEKLGRNLKDIIIVDNSPLSYSFHPNNGLPILSWFEDKNDRELFNITPILIFLSKVNDVRDFIPKIVIDNSISYLEVKKLLKKYKFKYENKKNDNFNKIPENIIKDNSNKNNAFNLVKYNNIYENKSKEYNININIVQNNISNINNIFDEKQKKELKNKIIKYLNISNNTESNIKNQKQVLDKLLKLKQKNIISNIDSPSNNKISNKLKENNNTNNICHKRLKTYNENLNNIKTQKEKNNKKIIEFNKNNKQKVKKLIQKLYTETIKRSENSVNYKKIQNFLKKRRKKELEKTLNSISFKNNSNNKLKRNSYNKKRIINRSVSNKRYNSNKNRTKLNLQGEYFGNDIIKKLYNISCKSKINNNNKKRNYNQINLFEYKKKFKSNNNFHLSSYKVETNNKSLFIKKHSNNKISKKFKIFDKISTPYHRKQKSYNEDNFFTQIKKNSNFKTKRIFNKNDFLKKEIQKISNNSNQINVNSNASDYKNKLIKRVFGNFKKINLKNIDFITKRDKRRFFQTEMKEKNIEINKTNINIHRVNIMNIHENLFNLYKSLIRNKKKKKREKSAFNKTVDNFLRSKNYFKKINHQKTISYNLNSTRNMNNNIINSKNRIKSKFKINHLIKIKSFRRQSQKEFNSFQEELKKFKKEKDDVLFDMKFVLKNKFLDYINLTKDNFSISNRNIMKSKIKGIKTINKNNNINKKSGIF